MTKKNIFLYFLILIVLIVPIIVYVNARDSVVVWNKRRVGCQYFIDGVWVDQFSGVIEDVNDTVISVKWYKYDEIDYSRIDFIETKKYDDYQYYLDFFIIEDNITGLYKTRGVFVVHFYYKGFIVDTHYSEGEIFVRDINGVRVGKDYIDSVRKYEYYVGDYN